MLEVLQAGSWGVGLQSAPTTVFHPPRSIESPSLGFGADPFLPHLLEDEQGQLSDLEPELDSQNWQHTVGRELLASLPQKEIDRQEVINGEELGVRSWESAGTAQGHLQLLCLSTELFATEGSHLRILRVLDLLFYQRMRKESLLSREELALLFPNLPDVIEIHSKFFLPSPLPCEPSCSGSTALGFTVTSLGWEHCPHFSSPVSLCWGLCYSRICQCPCLAGLFDCCRSL